MRVERNEERVRKKISKRKLFQIGSLLKMFARKDMFLVREQI